MKKQTGNRKSIRIKGFDYSSAGAYFVTINTKNQSNIFAVVNDGIITLSEYGKIAKQCWLDIPNHFTNVELDVFVIMPNHIHGILFLNEYYDKGEACLAPTQSNVSDKGTVGNIVGSFKSAVTKRINDIRGLSGATIWQRNYYEHVIRHDSDLDELRRYITNNPKQWDNDEYNLGL
ncbi:MAG TPA: transposase [candidate division Zixibacteria bacterium]|nr:transposase [candidate division Zixibacteria bacterium]